MYLIIKYLPLHHLTTYINTETLNVGKGYKPSTPRYGFFVYKVVRYFFMKVGGFFYAPFQLKNFTIFTDREVGHLPYKLTISYV